MIVWSACAAALLSLPSVSARTICGAAITAPAADGTTPPAPSGIVLKPEDFAEIYVLVKTGTPVTIQ